MASESPKKYTIAEVSEHNKEDDVWVIIHDKVYELTKFLEEHPGGSEVLVEVAGKEATQEFVDIAHSSDAVEMMKSFCIGEIVESEKRVQPKPEGSAPNCLTKALVVTGSALAVLAGAILIGTAYKMKKSM